MSDLSDALLSGMNGSGPIGAEEDPWRARMSALSLPSIPEWPGTQRSSTLMSDVRLERDVRHLLTVDIVIMVLSMAWSAA